MGKILGNRVTFTRPFSVFFFLSFSFFFFLRTGASLVAQMVKESAAMQKNWVGFLGWEDPLEKAMAAHSSI